MPAEPLEEVMDNSSDWNGSGIMGPPGEKRQETYRFATQWLQQLVEADLVGIPAWYGCPRPIVLEQNYQVSAS